VNDDNEQQHLSLFAIWLPDLLWWCSLVSICWGDVHHHCMASLPWWCCIVVVVVKSWCDQDVVWLSSCHVAVVWSWVSEVDWDEGRMGAHHYDNVHDDDE